MELEDELKWEEDLLNDARSHYDNAVKRHQRKVQACREFTGDSEIIKPLVFVLTTITTIFFIVSLTLLSPWIVTKHRELSSRLIKPYYSKMQNVDEVKPQVINNSQYKENIYVIDNTKTIREQDVYNCAPVKPSSTSCYSNCGKYYYGFREITYEQFQNNCALVREVIQV